MQMRHFKTAGLAALAAIAGSLPAFAQSAAPKLDTGNTAWMLTSTALVLMMTVPGLALFYGGMVRKKNVLATAMQSFAICCLVTVLWMIVGYSLAFKDGGGVNAYIGGLQSFFLRGMTDDTLSGTIPETVFMTFQMTFAIITPALIAGAFADRMKFSAHALVHGDLEHRRLQPDRALGVGRRLPRRPRRQGLRRRHGRPHQCRRGRASSAPSSSASARATARRTWHRTTSCSR